MNSKQCIQAWLDEIRPFGDVLEIGSKAPLPLKAFHLKTHRRIDLEKESWQKALPLLGVFDFILYNGPFIEKAHVETGSLLLKEGKKAVQKVHEAIPELSKIRYRDQDLDLLSEQIGEKQKPYLSRFLSELLENEQITQSQYLRQVKKWDLKKEGPSKKGPQTDTLFECIQECLHHMQKGSRFSCLIGAATKYEDPRFFESIITNPSFDYQENSVNDSNYILIERL